MAATPLQNPDTTQNQDSSIQQQNADNLPSTTTQSDLQSNTTDVNNLRTNQLKVTTGPVSSSKKAASGTVQSIILVVTILIVAASLYIASLRVPDAKNKKDVDAARPTVAPGGEEHGALGTKGISKRKLKKQRKGKN